MLSIMPDQSSADKVLVTLDFEFQNIATSEVAPIRSGAEGFKYFVKEACMVRSGSEEDILPAREDGKRKQFPYSEMIKYYDKIFTQTGLSRYINLKWQIINYQPREDACFDIADGYHLFGIEWHRSKLLYRFKKQNGQWAEGECLPTAFYFEEPSKATIKGLEMLM